MIYGIFFAVGAIALLTAMYAPDKIDMRTGVIGVSTLLLITSMGAYLDSLPDVPTEKHARCVAGLPFNSDDGERWYLASGDCE